MTRCLFRSCLLRYVACSSCTPILCPSPPPPAWMQVAGSPELYPILVDMGCVPTLLACLSHENTDIAADTLELFMELSGAGVKGGGAKSTGGVERGGRYTQEGD